MERQKTRKGHENRRLTCGSLDFSTNGRETMYNEKSKYKRHGYSDKKKYDLSPNSYSLNWSPPPRLHPIAQRQFSTSESSVCHYSVPLSLSLEPVSLPIYSAFIQPQGNCTVPLEIESHSNIMKSHKKRNKNRQAKSIDQSEPPAIFSTSRLNNGDHQDYTSLPPVNCDIYTAKSSDNEAACKRRFSDPGIGQISSDECSSSRSDDSSSSETPEVQSHDFYSLIEQVNELKGSNSHLKKELHEARVELESLKMQSLNWRTGCEEFKPGTLSDAISEIRTAVKLGEEALMSKVIQMLERNSNECVEAQEKLRQEVNERLSKLEEQMNKASRKENPDLTPPETSEQTTKDKNADIQQQLVELEREKFQLRVELQEAVAKRKSAEATTERLERLVGILRKKINGVSLESCITDEKHILARPLAASLEKNPFIMANNRQVQKFDTLPFTKPKIPPFRGLPLESPDGTNVVVNENKENEAGESGNGKGSPGGNSSSHPPSETSSVTAQVTITGPVTDL